MGKKVIISLLVLSFIVMCFGANGRSRDNKQDKPNFSGTWKLDRTRGNYVSRASLKPEDDLMLVISHAEPEIKVIRKFIKGGQKQIQDLTYYSDCRGEVGYTFIDRKKSKSKTEWEGAAIVSRFSVPLESTSREDTYVNVTESWVLSDDGKTLTQTQQFQISKKSRSSLDSQLPRIPMPQITETQIFFNRVS
jgi:hypothetical protein